MTIQQHKSVAMTDECVDPLDTVLSSCLSYSSERGGAFTLVSVPVGRFTGHGSGTPVRPETPGLVLGSDVEYLTSVYGFSAFPLHLESLEIPTVARASVTASPTALTVSLPGTRPLVACHVRAAHPAWVEEATGGSTVLGICVGVDLAAYGVDGFFAALDADRAVLGEVSTSWTCFRLH
jgi:hypothetical protein